MLKVKDLSIRFTRYTASYTREQLEAVSSIDIDVAKGEIVAVIGSSGSGKSLLAHAILGILPKNALTGGSIAYNGEELTQKRLAKLRGREIALIPQSVTYLDPTMRVGKQVAGTSRTRGETEEVFRSFGLAKEVTDFYPHQISGGMARRVLVAAALISGASLILADEPTPGLSDKLIREACGHLRALADAGRGVLLITHDIMAALTVADKISIFYAGSNVETAPREDFTGAGEALRHPYTKALWNALPQNGFFPLAGFQPASGPSDSSPKGCPFLKRCQNAGSECAAPVPSRPVRGGAVRCVYAA
ncbi:MAG: ABC transporter ATP-binding protein [Spirochaetaceae bacterium]|jgi:peptide/nickel transport system ATP-binding protein|nr:ABC transporter ATP-binding protein [Spirochaetaceae bacterium]